MIPLCEYVCDTCGELIVSPDEGYLEWVGGVGIKDHSFKIIHHKHECQRKEKDLPNGFIKDGSLSRYLGVENLQNLYTLLHPGPLYGKGKGILVEDINEYMEILRRLTIPYYEEARIYWPLAEEDGFFCDVNEVYPCLVSTLKLIIEKYK